MNFKITSKLVLLCFTLVLITATVMGSFSVYQHRQSLIDSLLKEKENEIQLLSFHIDSKIDELKNDVLFLSATPPISGIISGGKTSDDNSTVEQWKNRLSTIFKEIMYAKKDYTQIRFIGVKDGGKELVRVERKRSKVFRVIKSDLQSKEKESYFKGTLSLGREDIYLSDFSANKEFGKVVLPVQMVLRAAVPVFKTRQDPFGLIIININYNNIFSGLKQVTKDGADYFVADDKGNILLHSNPDFNIGHDLSTMKKVKDYMPELQDIYTKKEDLITKEIDHNQKKIIISKKLRYNPINRNNYLSIFLVVDKNKVLAKAREETTKDLWIVTALALLSVAFSAYFSRFITVPIKKLILFAENIGKNNRNSVSPIDINSKDEIGILAQKLYEMSNEIEVKNAALKHQKEALDNSALVVELNSDMKITNVNEKFSEVSRFTKDSLMGLRFKELGADKSIEYYENILTKVKSERMWKGEERYETKDGMTYWVDTVIYPIMNSSQEIEKFIVIMFDITEKKDAQMKLQVAAEAKSSFLANMSHEIRTPLNGIIGFTSLLSDLKLSKEAVEQIGYIKDCSEGLLMIINDILDYSKIEAGKLNIEKVALNLEKTLESTLLVFNSAVSKKDIDLSFSIDKKVPMGLEGDPLRLRQVFLNLVGNAVKFTEEGSINVSIDVKESFENGEMELICKIQDTGVGISKAALSNLFNPFEQADASTTRNYGGTGLGLSICTKIVELMGGRIWARSVEGKGSEFFFTFTTREMTVEVKVDRASVVQRPLKFAGEEISILLAEDNRINQKLAMSCLSKLGCGSVDVAENGLEVIEKVQDKDYDIIFMDIQMPEMDGLEATQIVRKKVGAGSDLVIVGLSANVFPEDVQKGLDAGMDNYLGKPLKMSELSKVINEVRANRKLAS